ALSQSWQPSRSGLVRLRSRSLTPPRTRRRKRRLRPTHTSPTRWWFALQLPCSRAPPIPLIGPAGSLTVDASRDWLSRQSPRRQARGAQTTQRSVGETSRERGIHPTSAALTHAAIQHRPSALRPRRLTNTTQVYGPGGPLPM